MNNNTAYLYIDESEDNQCLYLCATLILSEDKKSIIKSLKETKKNLENNQFIGLDKKSIKKLLHYVDDSDGVRSEVTNSIKMQFYKSYIAKKSFITENYSEIYYLLLRALVKDRVIKHKDRNFIINYEQNSKIKIQKMQEIVNEILKEINEMGKYHIKTSPTVVKVTKEDILITLPDYCLGNFLTYIKEKRKPKEKSIMFKVQRFEGIRSKIRLFIDLDKKIYHSRRMFNEV